MRLRLSASVVLVVAMVLLAACGGARGSDDSEPARPNATTSTFDPNILSAIVLGPADVPADVRPVEGIFNPNAATTPGDSFTTTYKAGNTGPGRDEMRGGVAQCSDGLDMMRSGLRMMSGDMMGRCGGSPENMMDGLDRGLGTMREGMSMLDDADPTNDADGMAKMDAGAKTAEDGMGAMDGATSCMGHGRMM